MENNLQSNNINAEIGNPNQAKGEIPLNQMEPELKFNDQAQENIIKNLESQESGIMTVKYQIANNFESKKSFFLAMPGDSGPLLTCLEDSKECLDPKRQEINLKVGLDGDSISKNVSEGSLTRKLGSTCNTNNPAFIRLPGFGIKEEYKITTNTNCGANDVVMDSNANEIFKFSTSSSTTTCCRDNDPCYSRLIEFTVQDVRTGKSGLITKKVKETSFTNNYKIDFPSGISAQ